MKSILFIVNPIPIYSNLFDEHIVMEYFKNKPYKVYIKQTEYSKHATQLANEAKKNKIDIVVAVGGDGTIHEIAQSLVYTKTKLAMIPTGFSSAFPNYFNIPWNLEQCLDILVKEHTKEIDTFKLKNDLCGSIYGVSFLGIGLTGQVVHSINQTSIKNDQYYWIKSIRAYLKRTISEIDLKFNFSKINTQPYELLIANVDQFKSKMKFSKTARVDDGLLDIVLTDDLSIPKFISFVFKNLIRKTTPHDLPADFYKTEQIELYSKKKLNIQIDFEPYEILHNSSISIEPFSLNVIIPQNKKSSTTYSLKKEKITA